MRKLKDPENRRAPYHRGLMPQEMVNAQTSTAASANGTMFLSRDAEREVVNAARKRISQYEREGPH